VHKMSERRQNRRSFFEGEIILPLVRDEGVAGSNLATPTNT
jgi:hypothetical protein